MATVRKIRKRRTKSNSNGMTRWDIAKVVFTLMGVIILSLMANGMFPSGAGPANVVTASVYPAATIGADLANTRRVTAQVTQEERPKRKHVIGVVRPLRPIPDGLNNFRATSITPEELRSALVMGTLKKVMNLSGDIPGKMTMAEIRIICQEYGVEYVTSGTLDRFAAHDGYQEGRGYVRSAAAAARHLLGGNVLVVDRSGNRAGALIGYYLMVHHGFSLEAVIRHNNWEAFSNQPGRSFKYLETVVRANP